jgi:hypothetical protein
MSEPTQPSANILIASDSTTAATLVKKLLNDEFENLYTSTDPRKAANDFDLQRPDVLVLAFGSLDKSERYGLGLYRQSKEIHWQPHRTIIRVPPAGGLKFGHQTCIRSLKLEFQPKATQCRRLS